MHIIDVRNVHDALPEGIEQLMTHGYSEPSRNGAVKLFPYPVTTIYRRPDERVMFHAKRDCNPFFHLYESLWMLAGRRDVASVAAYVKRMATFSDDGKNFHGAYGHRWRHHFKIDQLAEIIKGLSANPKDRRMVLQMWDARADLGKEGKDFPCNLLATFRINPLGNLDMMVANRSNDMIWGAYGANAVHFSFLQEYVAGCLGLPLGFYWQVSSNFHAYEEVLTPLIPLMYEQSNPYDDDGSLPPSAARVKPMPLFAPGEGQAKFDLDLMVYMDKGPVTGLSTKFFNQVVTPMHWAHQSWKQGDPERYDRTTEILAQVGASDWRKAALEWVKRRTPNGA